jgi:hypothetical protein
MLVFERSAKEWKPEHKHQQAPLLPSPVNESCVLIDKDHQTVIAAQIQLGDDAQDVMKQITRMLRHDIRWNIDKGRPARMSGIASANKVFGTLEPNRLRQRFGCKRAALDRDQPQLKRLLDTIAVESFNELNNIDPYRATDHKNLVDKHIHPDWLIAKQPFTSGVINYSAALPYHRDSGNIIGSWSAMVCSRKHMAGGNLHLPEYDLLLGVPNNSLILFDGQGTWHGVTPMVAEKKDAYRFTIVYYAKNKVCDCVAAELELERSAKNAMHSAQSLDSTKWKKQ